jgi:hypothetical protein
MYRGHLQLQTFSMHTPIRRVDHDGTSEQLPKAQYCDEFCHSFFTSTSGHVCISSQLALPKGADIPGFTDFFNSNCEIQANELIHERPIQVCMDDYLC